MSESVIIGVAPTLGVIVIAVMQWLQGRRITGVAADAKTAAEQTQNTHSKNLRDDLDEKVSSLEDGIQRVSGQVHGLAESQRRTEAWLRDLAKADHAIEDTVDRKELAAARDLKAAVEERDAKIDDLVRVTVPDIIRKELSEHIAACPLRRPGDQ